MGETKEKRIGFEIKKVSNLLKSKFTEIVRSNHDSSDFPQQYFWILGYLYRNRDSVICQKDLEKAFCQGRATMSKTVSALESMGYIERKQVEGDKRLNRIALTEKGTEQENKVKESLIQFDEKLKAVLTDDEKEQLFTILDKLSDALQEQKSE